MSLDIYLFRLLNDLAGQSAYADKALIFLGNYLIYAIGLALLTAFFMWRKPFSYKLKVAGIFVSIAVLAYLLIILVLHPLWPRERPFESLLNVHQLIPETGTSFPSKHATFSFLIAAFVFGFNRRVGLWFFLAALLVAFGRVAVGVHYPLDVAAGGLMGGMIGWFGFWLSKKLSVK